MSVQAIACGMQQHTFCTGLPSSDVRPDAIPGHREVLEGKAPWRSLRQHDKPSTAASLQQQACRASTSLPSKHSSAEAAPAWDFSSHLPARASGRLAQQSVLPDNTKTPGSKNGNQHTFLRQDLQVQDTRLQHQTAPGRHADCLKALQPKVLDNPGRLNMPASCFFSRVAHSETSSCEAQPRPLPPRLAGAQPFRPGLAPSMTAGLLGGLLTEDTISALQVAERHPEHATAMVQPTQAGKASHRVQQPEALPLTFRVQQATVQSSAAHAADSGCQSLPAGAHLGGAAPFSSTCNASSQARQGSGLRLAEGALHAGLPEMPASRCQSAQSDKSPWGPAKLCPASGQLLPPEGSSAGQQASFASRQASQQKPGSIQQASCGFSAGKQATAAAKEPVCHERTGHRPFCEAQEPPEAEAVYHSDSDVSDLILPAHLLHVQRSGFQPRSQPGPQNPLSQEAALSGQPLGSMARAGHGQGGSPSIQRQVGDPPPSPEQAYASARKYRVKSLGSARRNNLDADGMNEAACVNQQGVSFDQFASASLPASLPAHADAQLQGTSVANGISQAEDARRTEAAGKETPKDASFASVHAILSSIGSPTHQLVSHQDRLLQQQRSPDQGGSCCTSSLAHPSAAAANSHASPMSYAEALKVLGDCWPIHPGATRDSPSGQHAEPTRCWSGQQRCDRKAAGPEYAADTWHSARKQPGPDQTVQPPVHKEVYRSLHQDLQQEMLDQDDGQPLEGAAGVSSSAAFQAHHPCHVLSTQQAAPFSAVAFPTEGSPRDHSSAACGHGASGLGHQLQDGPEARNHSEMLWPDSAMSTQWLMAAAEVTARQNVAMAAVECESRSCRCKAQRQLSFQQVGPLSRAVVRSVAQGSAMTQVAQGLAHRNGQILLL